MKVYKVAGTDNGTNYFNIADWQTGSGGTWQNYYVNNGTISSISDTNPNCALSIDAFDVASVNVFPNPFSYVITILSKEQNYKVEMFDALGKRYSIEKSMDGTINTSHLSSGLYLLKVSTDTSQKTFKLFKS